MRVISGIYRGRRLFMPKGIRPTKDNVKESLFNVLRPDIKGARVLDLFSGSGALGIEALSRGAQETVFVDNSKVCTDIIDRSITKIVSCDEDASIRIINMDVCAAIKLMYKEDKKFDIVILDPPYNKLSRSPDRDAIYGPYNRNRIRKCLMYITVYDILPHSGLVVVEHFKKESLPVETEHLRLLRQLKYGDTIISIYNRSKND